MNGNSDFVIENGVLVKYQGPDGGVVVVPEGVTEIGVTAFHPNLHKESPVHGVILPSSVKKISASAFAGRRLLEEVTILSEDITIERYAFPCKGLKKLRISSRTAKISKAAFHGMNPDAKIILERLPLTKLPETQRVQAILTFAQQYCAGEVLPPEGQALHLKYIRQEHLALFSQVPKHPELLRLMLAERMITGEETTALLDLVQQQEDAEMIAAVLSYQKEYWGAEEQERHFQKQVHVMSTGSLPVSDAKKRWIYENTEGGGLRILGWQGWEKEVEVPSAIGENPVVEIGPYAFSPNAPRISKDLQILRREVRAITVPEGVTAVGAGAFEACAGLEEVRLPSTLQILEPGHDCLGREQCNPFLLCSPGLKLEIAEGNSHYRMENSMLIEQIETEERLIARLGKVEGAVTIPEGAKTIPAEFFADCDKLTDIVFPQTLQKIESGAFCGCIGLTQIMIPGSVANIGDKAFQDCTGLEQVTLQEGVKDIGSYAFRGCPRLTSIHLPDSYCENGWGIRKWWDNGLKKWTVSSDHPALATEGPLLMDKSRKTVHDCLPSACGELVIPKGVRNIDARAFQDCVNLTHIILPANVKSIGEFAFYGCIALKEVALPSNLRKIDEYTFAGCQLLTKISFPEHIQSIGKGAFSGCASLTELHIPEGPKKLGELTFARCCALAELTLPGSVQNIEQNALPKNPDLTLHAPAGSYAEQYAKENNISFQAL